MADAVAIDRAASTATVGGCVYALRTDANGAVRIIRESDACQVGLLGGAEARVVAFGSSNVADVGAIAAAWGDWDDAGPPIVWLHVICDYSDNPTWSADVHDGRLFVGVHGRHCPSRWGAVTARRDEHVDSVHASPAEAIAAAEARARAPMALLAVPGSLRDLRRIVRLKLSGRHTADAVLSRLAGGPDAAG